MPLPRKELVDALVNAFDAITFDRMLSDQLSIRREILFAATGQAGFTEIVSGIVQIADERHWVIDLIRAALTANPGSPALQAFIARNGAYDPANQPGVQNYYLSVFMRSRRVFFKRDEFRQKLQQIGVNNQSRVLAVDGDRFTGKTYSRDFLNFLRENEPGWVALKQQIVYINTDESAFEAEDLARTVGRRLGLDPATMPHDKGEQATRRLPDLIDWLRLGVQNSDVDRWWIVLDGFRIQVLPRVTHDFIRAIIEAVEFDLETVRVVLLNYQDYLDLDLSTFILREKIDAIDEERDLSLFFRHVYTLSRKTFVDADIDQTVSDFRRQVNEEVTKRGPELRMKLLSLGLTRAANELLK